MELMRFARVAARSLSNTEQGYSRTTICAGDIGCHARAQATGRGNCVCARACARPPEEANAQPARRKTPSSVVVTLAPHPLTLGCHRILFAEQRRCVCHSKE